jgi:hypothetical protein
VAAAAARLEPARRLTPRRRSGLALVFRHAASQEVLRWAAQFRLIGPAVMTGNARVPASTGIAGAPGDDMIAAAGRDPGQGVRRV